MNTKAYREWLHELVRLTRSQRKSVLNQLNAVESREFIIDELETNHAHQPSTHTAKVAGWADGDGNLGCNDSAAKRTRHRACQSALKSYHLSASKSFLMVL